MKGSWKKTEPVIDIKSNGGACEKKDCERKTADYKRNWLILNGMSNFHGHGEKIDKSNVPKDPDFTLFLMEHLLMMLNIINYLSKSK